MALKQVGISLTAQGKAQYLSDLQNISSAMSKLKAETDLAMAKLGNHGSATDKYKTKMKGLNDSYKQSESRVKAYKDRLTELPKAQQQLTTSLDKTKKAFEDSTKKTAALKYEYDKLKKSGKASADELKKAESAYKSSNAETKALRKSVNDLTKEYDANGKELDELPLKITKAETATQKLKNSAQKLHEEYRNNGGRLADTAKSWQDFGNKVAGVGDKMKSAGSYMTTRFTVPIVGGLTAAVKEASKFHSEIGALAPLLAQGKPITQDIRNQVIEMGKASRKAAKDYGQDTSQINAAMAQLVRNGYDSNQVLGMMPQLLDASLASGDDFNDVMKVSSQVMAEFGLKGKDYNETMTNSARVTDALTYVANATSSGFADLGLGMSYVGPIAKSLNMTVEETAAYLGILSDNGIEASKGGTALRGAFTRLLKPSKQNAEAMAELGFSSEEFKKGSLKLPDIIDRIKESTKNLTDEERAALIAKAFGTEAQTAMNALVNEGSEKLRTLTKETENAKGSTKAIADEMKKMPEFKFKQSIAQLKDLGIELGSKLLPHVLSLAEGFNKFLDSFNNLDEGTQNFILKSALIVAAIGPITGALGGLISGFGKVSGAVGDMIQWFGKITTPKSLADTADTIGDTVDALDDIPGAAGKAGGAASIFSNPWILGATAAIGGVVLLGLAIKDAADEPFKAHKKAVKDTDGAYQTWFDGVTKGAGKINELGKSAQDSAKQTTDVYQQQLERMKLMKETAMMERDLTSNFTGRKDPKPTYYGKTPAFKQYYGAERDLKETYHMDDNQIAEIQKKYNNYATMLHSSFAQIAKAANDNTIVTRDWAVAQSDAVKGVTDTVSAELGKQRDAQIQALEAKKQAHPEFAAEYDKEIETVKSAYDTQIKAVNDAYSTINNILTENAQKGTEITDQQAVAMLQAYDTIAKGAGKSLTEMDGAMQMLGDNLSAFVSDAGLKFLVGAGMISEGVAKSVAETPDATKKVQLLKEALDEYSKKNPEVKNLKVKTDGEAQLKQMTDLLGINWNALKIKQHTLSAKFQGKQLIEEAVKSLVDWDKLTPAEKKMVMDTAEAYAKTQEMNKKLDEVNKKEVEPKKVEVKTFGEAELEGIIQMFGIGGWGGIEPGVKEAIVNAQGGEVLENYLTDLGLWNGATVDQKRLVLETEQPIQAASKAIEAAGLWNNTEFVDKLAKIDTTAPEAKQQIIDLINEYGGAKALEANPITISATADSLPPVAQNVMDVVNKVNAALGIPPITVSATSSGVAETSAQVSDMRTSAEQADGKNVSVTANAIGAAVAAAALVLFNTATGSMQSKDVTATATQNGVDSTKSSIDGYNTASGAMTNTSATATTSAPTADSNAASINNYNYAADSMGNSSATASTYAPNADGNAGSIMNFVGATNSLYDKSVTVTTYHDTVFRQFGTPMFAGGGNISFNAPMFANGGKLTFAGMFASGANTVPSGFSGIVGEAGPELFEVGKGGVRITPLSTGEKMRGISGALGDKKAQEPTVNVNINVNNPVVREDNDIVEIVKRVKEELVREMKRNKIMMTGGAVGYV